MENERIFPARPTMHVGQDAEQGSHVSTQGVLRNAVGQPGRAVRFLDGLVTISIAALFLGLPIFFTGITLQGLAFEKQLYFYFWLLLSVVAWVLKGMIVGELRVRRTFLDGPIWIFLVVYVGSAFASVDWWRSFWGPFNDPSRGVLSIVSYVLAYYVIMSHFTPRRLTVWLTAILVSMVLVVPWTMFVIFGGHNLPGNLEQYAPISLLGTVTNLAFFLAACLPILTIGITKAYDIKRFGKSLAAVLGISMILTFILFFALFNYVPWPAALLGMGMLAIYVLAQVVRPGENWSWLPMLTLALTLLIVMFGEVNFSKIQLPVEASPNLKLSWVITKDTLQNNFFLGSGPGTYMNDFSLYRPAEYNLTQLSQLRFFQGRGILFEMLPTIGVIGTFAFLILVLSFLSFGFYLLSHGRENNKVYSLGLWSSIVILMVGSFMISVNSAILAFAILISALGFATLLWESRTEEQIWNLSLKVPHQFALVSAFVFLVAIVGTVFLFAFIGKALIADVFAGRAIAFARTPDNVAAVSTNMGRAMNFMPKESQYNVVLGRVYLALANVEANKPESERNLNDLASYVNAATKLLETAKSTSSNDIGVQESLAQIYESKLVLAGASEELLNPLQIAYERALELEPNNPLFFLKLGQIQEARGSLVKEATSQARTDALNKAKEYFQQAADKQNTFAPAYLNIALVDETLGTSKDDVVLENLKKAATLDPQSQDVAYHLGRVYRLRGGEDDLKQAEAIFGGLVKIDDKNQQYHLNLGLTYEAMKKKDDAVKQYQVILDSIQGDTDAVKPVRKQLQTMIDNVRSGKNNLTVANAQGAQTQSQPSVNLAPPAELPQSQQQPVQPQVQPAP